MDRTRALLLALAFLTAFKESGSIYQNYIVENDINDADYDMMLTKLFEMGDEHLKTLGI